jgi:Uma2 family endonuclease
MGDPRCSRTASAGEGHSFRVPDISVVTGPPPDGGIVVEPPYLCIEILSPSDRMKEMQERIDYYLNFGVRGEACARESPCRALHSALQALGQ